MSLNDMPDDVLIRLLNTASPHDVARAKRVNKRFNQLVETYNLGKPRVKEFSIESRLSPMIPPHKLGRLRLGTSSISKRRVVVTMRKEKGVKRLERLEDPSSSTESDNKFVQENMRKVVLNEKLSFDGVNFDDDFYNMLTAKGNNLKHVTTLALSLCHIRINWIQWADLLGRMNIKQLYVDFCTFDSSLFSDKVLMSLPHLEVLQIQPRYPCFLNELTDQTVLYWATRGTIPSTILFRQTCGSRVSPDGVRNLMTSALSNPSNSSIKFDWDFGLLMEPAQSDSVLLSFVLCPGSDVKVTDDFRSRRVNLQRETLNLQFHLPIPIPNLSLPTNS